MRTPPEIIWYCPKCKEVGENPYHPITGNNICTKHKIKMEEIDVSFKEYVTIENISKDISFIEAMINLKQQDPIEYQLKMSQFKSVQAQQSREKEKSEPHCPHCKSTNISKIGTGERIGSIAMLGIFSKKINKSFKCKNCGYTW